MVVRGVRSRTKDKAQKKSSLASPKDSAVMIAQIGKKGESFLRLLREKGTKNPQIIGGSERRGIQDFRTPQKPVHTCLLPFPPSSPSLPGLSCPFPSFPFPS